MGGELYVNGKVFTGEGETHFASAFRITDGAFSWVGDSSDVAGGTRSIFEAGRCCRDSSTCTPIRPSCRC